MSHCVWGQRGVQGSAKELLYPSTSSIMNQNDAFSSASASSAASAAATPQVLCMSWNHDGSCLAVGTVDGFRIYSTEYISGSDAASFNPSSTSSSSSSRASGSDLNHHRLVEVANRNVRGGVRHIALHEQGSVVLFSGASSATESIVTLWDDAAGEGDDGNPIQRHRVAGEGDDNDRPHGLPSGDEGDERGPLFHRPMTDADVHSACAIGRLELAAPVAGLRLHDRLVVVAEPFRVHLYDTFLVHLDTLHTPNHGKRSASFSEKGDLGLVWDNGAQSIAVAAITGYELVSSALTNASISSSSSSNAGIPVVRVLTLGPTVGSVRCLHYFSSPSNTFTGSRASAATSLTAINASRTPTSLGASAMPTTTSTTGNRWIESKLVGPTPHSHRVQCLAISPDGTLGLSCSIQGTAIKLIDTKRAVLLKQFTRGITTSVIGCLALSVDGRLAACIGRSGTVHVFSCSSSGAAGGGGVMAAAAGRPGGSGTTTGRSSNPADNSGVGGSFSSMFKSVLQGVAQVGALDSLQAYLSSDYAITTFNLNIANADSDGLRLRSSLSPADAGSEARSHSTEKTSQEKRSAISEAFLLQDEDNLQRVLDVSEHSGFDPLFTALQFRPGFHNFRSNTTAASSPASTAASQPSSSLCYANMFLACGNVTPEGYGLKSKCIQVAVPLPSSLIFGNHQHHHHPSTAPSGGGGGGYQHQQNQHHGAATTTAAIEPPFVTHTSLFPKDSL
jgi:WD40 repeat protein